MANLTDLATYMDRVANAVPDFGNQVAKDVANTILSDLTQVTPVDVGEAVSNWQVTLDAPAVSDVPAFAPSPKGRVVKGVWVHKVDPVITAQANVPPTVQAGQAEIAKKKPGQVLFITNNAPHIVQLDAGTSDQAPAGFVNRAMALGAQIIGNRKLKP